MNPVLRHWLEGVFFSLLATVATAGADYLKINPIPDGDPFVVMMLTGLLLALANWARHRSSSDRESESGPAPEPHG